MNRYMGRNDLQKQKDDLAISIMDAFITVVYYQGLVKMCSEKLEDSQRLLYKRVARKNWVEREGRRCPDRIAGSW